MMGMQDKTEYYPSVEQTSVSDRKQVDKHSVIMSLGYHIQHGNQLNISVVENGNYLRVVAPGSGLMSNITEIYEGLKKCNGVNAADADLYCFQMEQQMKKKRKTIKADVPYEISYIRLTQTVDPSKSPWFKTIKKKGESSILYVILTLPCNTTYAEEEDGSIVAL